MRSKLLYELVDLYLVRCGVEGKSPATISAYKWTLGRFLKSIKKHRLPIEARAVEREHIYKYLSEFSNNSADTKHRYFREVRCFFNWLEDLEVIEKNPFAGMKNVRLPQKIIRPYSEDDIRALLSACPETDIGVRDKAIILTLLDTGMRCSELINVDMDQLDMPARRIRILFGKGNKQRVVSFAKSCEKAIKKYVRVREDRPGPLFLSSNGQGKLTPERLSASGLKQMLRRLGKKSGVKKTHAHRFRHTFATWAIQKDARELDVQYLLGHSTSDMVRRYSSSYRSEQAALRHKSFSPADQVSI